MSRPPRALCVIGHPIGHSRSPLIHGHWIAIHGLDATYTAVDVAPGDLARFVANLADSGYAGCNVTLPHKEAVAALVDVVDPTARQLQSVNTLYFRHGKLHGTSTDGAGYADHLLDAHPAFQPRGASIVVLGAGGAAKSICLELSARGAGHIHVCNRNRSRAEELAAALGPVASACSFDAVADIMPTAGLIINTTSLGMTGQPPLQLPLDKTGPACIISDIVYAPLVTPLLADAQRLGRPVLDGLGMLLHQAARAFELWFGFRPDVSSELRNLVVRHLEQE